MNYLIRIRQHYPDLAQSDKKLAGYLLAQPDAARHPSSQQLAFEAGVSQFSVVRFTQKMDFRGFPALKLAISEALTSGPNPHSIPVRDQIRGNDLIRMVGEGLIKENVTAIHMTLDVNSEEELIESVTMLHSARHIIVVGIGAPGPVAQNFAWKLLKIGFNAVMGRDIRASLATVQVLSPDDLLPAISYTGEHREFNLTVNETLRIGTKILAITGFIPDTLQ